MTDLTNHPKWEEWVEKGAQAACNLKRASVDLPPLSCPVSKIREGNLWLAEARANLSAVAPLIWAAARKEALEEAAKDLDEKAALSLKSANNPDLNAKAKSNAAVAYYARVNDAESIRSLAEKEPT
jgi:hypothetical protein